MDAENGTQPKNKRLVILAVFLAVLLLSALFTTIQSIRVETLPTQIPTQAPAPILNVSAESDQRLIPKDKTLRVLITANSQGQPITGFDAVLDFDPKVWRFQSAVSGHQDFDVIANFDEELGQGRLFITGSKKITSSNAVAFDENVIATATFIPKKINVFTIFSLEYTAGSKKDSNLINEKSEDILQEAGAVSILAGSQITLRKGKNLTLPEGISLTLVQIQNDQPDCRDCMAYAKVMVGGRSVEFTEGGLAGYRQTRADVTTPAGNLWLEVSAFGHDSITLNYSYVKN